MVDLTKLAFHSSYPAFKNNAVYTGSFTISGNYGGGVHTITTTVPLSRIPDIVDIMYRGDSDTAFEPVYGDSDPRPDAGWFRKGAVWANGDDGFGGFPTPWRISYEIQGINVVIKATYVQIFTDTTTITGETVNYRIVDYSIF